jgi:ketosteroid isomerase-like protein
MCLAASSLTVAPAQAAEASDVAEAIATIREYIAPETREAYAAHCAADVMVIDHVPPYVFQGPNACAEHWDAIIAWTARNRVEVSNWGSITEPDFVDVSADLIYAIFPARVDWIRDGAPEIERGTWTFVVRRGEHGWRRAPDTFSTLEIAPAAVLPVPTSRDTDRE